MMGTWLVEWSGAYVQPTKLDAFPFFFPFSFPRNFCAEDYHVLCHTIGFLLCFFLLPTRLSFQFVPWMDGVGWRRAAHFVYNKRWRDR